MLITLNTFCMRAKERAHRFTQTLTTPPTVPLEHIIELRTGPLCSHFNAAQDDRVFSVIFSTAYKELCFVTPSARDVCEGVWACMERNRFESHTGLCPVAHSVRDVCGARVCAILIV